MLDSLRATGYAAVLLQVRTFTAAVLMGLLTPALAQDQLKPQHQLTSPIPGARYEIVQSGIAAKWTFRLDRYTGAVAQIVSTKSDGVAWEDMVVLGLPRVTPSKPRFQVFTSGIAARFTVLFDSETG